MIWSGLIGFINLLIRALGAALELVILLLPPSPFQVVAANGTVAEYMGMLNWFIPVSTLLGIASSWTSAVLLYYIVSTVLRWGKAIE